MSRVRSFRDGFNGWVDRHPWLWTLLYIIFIDAGITLSSLRYQPPAAHREAVITAALILAIGWPLGGLVRRQIAKAGWTAPRTEPNPFRWVGAILVFVVAVVIGAMLVSDVVKMVGH